jgi:FixJ family two-component response regulator
MSGLELHRHLQAAGSSLAVILVTGTTELTTVELSPHNGLIVLEKPYTASDLIRIVRHSLDHNHDH